MRVTHTTHYLAIYIVSKHEMDATWTLCISLSTRASRALCCPSRVGVGNLLELPAAAVLWCGCRSWLPVIAVTGSSSVATSGATGCCWLCCCLSGVTLARVVGLCWRHFLLGRRSHRADLHNPIDLCQGALPLGHVFVEASTTRRHDEFAALARRCHSCVPEKWYVSQI